MPLYRVDDGTKVRLIEAKTKQGARSFAASTRIKVDIASAHDAHKLAARGVRIESESDDPNQTDIEDQPNG